MNEIIKIESASTVIESLGVYLPPKTVSTAEIMKGCKHRIHIPFESLTGIGSRRMAGDTEFSIDLAEQSVEKCLAASKYSPAQIDMLISANISRCDGPDFQFSFEPSTGIRLKKRFGFINAMVFDLSNACAGMFTAIKIIDTLINSGLIKTGMVVSGEYITHLTKTAQKEIVGYLDERLACLTLGDAGAAIILEKSNNGTDGFHCIEMSTLEQFSALCIAKPSRESHGGGVMYTDMVSLSSAGFKYGNEHSVNTMMEFGWDVDSIRHYILHQTSKRTIKGVEREIKKRVPREKRRYVNMVDNLAERGNTASTSHIVALHDKIVENSINDHERILFGIFGSGLTVGTALYKLDDLPSRIRKNGISVESSKFNSHTAPITRYEQYVSDDLLPRIHIAAIGVSEPSPAENSTMQMIVQAAENCIRNAGIQKSEIDLLIHAGVYRDEFISEPAIATLVAKELDLHGDSADGGVNGFFAFDIMNGSLGLYNACYIASGLIKARKYRRILVVTAEIENNAVVGVDGRRDVQEIASAILLEASPNNEYGFGAFLVHNYLNNINALTSHVAQKNGKTFLVFNQSATLMERYLEGSLETFEHLLKISGVDPARIKVVIPPQISTDFVNTFRNNLLGFESKVIDATSSGKDLFGSSFPVALNRIRNEGRANHGDIGVFLNAASGIQIGAAIYYF